MTVGVTNDQATVILDAQRWADFVAEVLTVAGVAVSAEVGLSFVDESDIAELNRDHLGNDGPTDVLSFPLDGPDALLGEPVCESSPCGAPVMLGDIVLCPAVAARQAPEHAGTLDDELAVLLVHSCLHLLGHDHAESDERSVMWARERELLAATHGVPATDPWSRRS